MNILLALFSILFTSLVGFFLIKLFNLLPKKNNLFTLGISYGLGVGLISYQLYLYSRLGIRWDLFQIILPWVSFFILFIIKNKKNINILKFKCTRPDFISLLLILGIGASWFYTVLEAVIRPLSTWDGWATWIIKSNAFFLDRGILAQTVQYIKSDGPLIISLYGSFIYLWVGRIDDTAVLLYSSAYYIFLSILFFSVLRKNYSLRYSLLFTFLLSATQVLIRQGGRFEAGQADLPLGYYFFASVILFLDYFKSANVRLLILLSFFLGITSLVKFEGLPYAILTASLIVFSIIKSKKYNHLLFLFFWLIPVIDWQIYKKSINLGNVYFSEQGGHGFIISSEKMINAILGSFKEMINIKSWNVLWITYFFSLVFSFSRKNETLIILNLVVISQLLLYLFFYFFTFGNDPASSISRLLTHLAPIAVLVIAMVMKKILK